VESAGGRADLAIQIEALWEADAAEHPGDPGGPGDPGLVLRQLRARSWAVRQLAAAADLVRAADLGMRSLADSERVLGADHPDMLASRNNLGEAHQSAGRLGEAIPLYERTLADRERVPGADHPQTLTSRNNFKLARSGAKPTRGIFSRKRRSR
jgi:Tetratricopeptide repeat